MIGRIRTVKPEIFSDEKLWDLSQETGLPLLQAFEGLWCYADREGRFEWRPRALKTLILPYWEGDFADALEAFERGRYVVRYVVGGQVFGYVRSFAKHQRVNQREAPSMLPSPPVTTTHVHAHAGVAPVPEPSPAVDHLARGEGNGRELNGREGERATPVPGLTIVAEPEHGDRPVWKDLKGFVPPPELIAEAAIQGIPRKVFDERFAELAGGPIGGKRGTFDRADYVRRQFGKWRTWAETDAAKASIPSGARHHGSDLDTTSAATAFRLDAEHREFAAKLGRRSDIEAFAREYAQGETCKRLDTLGQSRDFMNRLKCLAHTGQWHPDGPLPKPPAKAREARA